MKRLILIVLTMISLQAFAMEQKPTANQNTLREKLGALFNAVIQRDALKVQNLLSDHEISSHKTILDTRALIKGMPTAASLIDFAVELPDPTILRHLIKAGASIETRNSEGQTPLLKAVYNRNVPAVRVLLKNKADVNVKSLRSKSSPLKYAVNNHDYSVIELLIGHGARLDEFQRGSRTEIENALLHKSQNDSNFYPEKFLLKAAKTNPNIIMRDNSRTRMPALHYLLRKFYEEYYNPQFVQGLNAATKKGEDILMKPEESKLIQSILQQIEAGFNINKIDSDDRTALAIAIENTDPTFVKWILSHHKANAMTYDSSKRITTITGLCTIDPTSRRPMQYVLNELEKVIKDKQIYLKLQFSDRVDELSLKKDRLLSIAEHLVSYNPYLCTQEIMFSNYLISPFEFAEQQGLHELTEILQKYNQLSLVEQTAKQLINNILATGFDDPKNNLGALPKEVIKNLVDEIDKLITVRQDKEALHNLKDGIIKTYLIQS